jgi:hypothetical protein
LHQIVVILHQPPPRQLRRDDNTKNAMTTADTRGGFA